MLKRYASTIFGGLTLVGFLFLLGTAGASDCDSIGITQIVTQGLVGVFMMGLGVCGLNFVETGYIGGR
jgi:hypothetical protein